MTTPVRPWARYVAKSMDMLIASLLLIPIFIAIGVLVVAVLVLNGQSVEFLDAPVQSPAVEAVYFAAGMVLLAIFFPLGEGICIASFGTTPGKSLLGIKLRDVETGNKLPMSRSIARSYGAYFYGVGLGVPLITLLTHIMSYEYLKGNDITRWDERQRALYETRRVSRFRWAFAIVLVVIGTVIARAI